MLFEQLGGSLMRIRANEGVAAHLVAYVLDPVLAHLFGLAEGAAHANDCRVMLFDPCFPGRDPLLHFVAALLLGKGIPSRHARAGFAAEKDGEERIVRAHGLSFFLG